MPDDTSHPRYHLSETFRAAWAKLRPGPLQWPSDEAIADCSRGPRGIPAVPITVAPVLHGAVSLSLFEFGIAETVIAERRKFLITVEGARFLRDVLADVIGAHDAGLSYTDWHKLQDESRVQRANSSGIPHSDGSPAEGHEQVPLASASAAASGEG
jgi:hypothetical protein